MAAENSTISCTVNAFKFFLFTKHKRCVLENLLFGSLSAFANNSNVNQHQSHVTE